MEDKAYGQRVILGWTNQTPLPSPQRKEWAPKNPEVSWPPMNREKKLTDIEWVNSGFPHNPLPDRVCSKINKVEWKSQIENMRVSPLGHAAVQLLQTVLGQLETGADSGVGPPGDTITKSLNFFTDPKDCMKMADSLATEIKSKTLAGPMDPDLFPQTKINSFMAIPKSSGDRRQVGNLSSPAGSAFNEGIPESLLKAWPVTQTTAKQFADKISKDGWGAVMSKCDMVSAYKTIPVCLRQRWLQGFLFCGKLFIDLCLIFGDRAACMIYDRFHFCILMYMVLPKTTLPSKAVGKTIDDITSVVPSGATAALNNFVKTYRNQLSALNIQAAPSDPECVKAFDSSKNGEILGVRFSTESMTWNLGAQKVKKLTDALRKISFSRATVSLHEIEVILGRATDFSQLSLPFCLLTSSLIQILGDLLSAHTASHREDRSVTILPVTEELRDDCRTMAAIVADSLTHPLPILAEPFTNLLSISVYTDASGSLPDSPSLGILVEGHRNTPPMVASLRFPYQFLHAKDKHGHSINNKTTLLESLGYLATLLLCPTNFMGQSVTFRIDCIGAVVALRKGRSVTDELATTVTRAARVVAAAIGCVIQSEWVPRRSNRQSVIADDLSHNHTSNLSKSELHSLLMMGAVSFPPPLLAWMADPRQDQTLGRKCLLWITGVNPDLVGLIPM